MAYSLKANIEDMGYQEAQAVLAAIFERYGSHIVEKELEAWRKSCLADVVTDDLKPAATDSADRQ